LPDSLLAEYDGAVLLLAKSYAPLPPPETSPSGLSPILTSMQQRFPLRMPQLEFLIYLQAIISMHYDNVQIESAKSYVLA
jgi:hypothetical protein